MKYSCFLFYLFLVFNFSHAQFSTSYEQVEVVLKSGDTLRGFGNVYSPKLRLKDESKKNRKDYNFSEISLVKFTIYRGKKKIEKRELVLVPLVIDESSEKQKKIVLAELFFDKQNIKIYGVYQEGGSVAMGAGLGGQISVTNMNFDFQPYAHTDYYCLFNGENKPVLMYRRTSLKSFKIMAMDCFNNCKLLCDKIKNEDFTKEDIIEIGDFYNDNCK
ncbi:MAG: hypothetical protein ACOVNM_04565 [Flavobacterium sp.]|jgi:hypothetical protein